MKKQWSTVLVIALMLLVVIFSVLNVDPVAINFGFTEVSIPLVIVIIGTLLIGILIAVIWSTTLVIKEKNQQKKLQKQIDHFEEDAKKEQDQINEKHQTEMESLRSEMEREKSENRDLKRRIQNMQANKSREENNSTDE